MKPEANPIQLARQLLDWFEKHARDLPWRRTTNPYAIWISEIMLQQTQEKTVIPYWERWMRALPDIGALARSDPQSVLKLWEGLGYYSRARNAHAAARMIVDLFKGEFPSTVDDLCRLPGVGRYTAGAVCSIAFNQPAAILDGNVARVLSRVYGIGGDLKSKIINERLWKQAAELVDCARQLPDCRLGGVSDGTLQIAKNFTLKRSSFSAQTTAVPGGNCSRLNQALMELGALICAPKTPACVECPLSQLCFARQSNRMADFPKSVARPVVTRRKFIAFLVLRNNKYLVQKRPENVVNASLWEFPNVEMVSGAPVNPNLAARFLVTEKKPLLRIMHSITRYRIQLEVYRAELEQGVKPTGTWVSLEKLKELPFASAHRKVIEMLPLRFQKDLQQFSF